MSLATLSADRLDWLQREAFEYFVYETNPANGLVADKTRPDWPASIAATGLALTAYPVGVERSFITRAKAVERTLVTLRFFQHSPQSMEPDATGYKGFYYHFLDMRTGRRVRNFLITRRFIVRGPQWVSGTGILAKIERLSNAFI